MSYSERLSTLSDLQLVEESGYKLPGSACSELINFEMERRAVVAQSEAAKATLRGAIAAERYTNATLFLIVVTAAGVLVSLLK